MKRKIAKICHKLEHYLPDSIYLQIFWYKQFHTFLNLKNPRTLNEKLQWLKLHNRKPEFTMMVDKFEVKKYVANIIGEKYIIPSYGVWENFEDIQFDKLPEQFVLKCTHDNKSTVICHNKSTFDFDSAKEKLENCLRRNFYWWSREWPYKNVKPRILAEQFLENSDRTAIVDYKFYCFNGQPEYFMYSVGEAAHNVRNHKFNLKLESIDYLFKKNPTIRLDEIDLPDNIDEMIQIVKKMCVGFPHIRIDLYNIDGKIYFGEMTFYSGAGIINIDSKEYSDYLAGLIDLSKVN